MPRTDVARRVVRASVPDTFAALVDEDAVLRWLPPGGMTGRFEHYDARPGGSYRMVLAHTDDTAGKTSGSSDVVDVRFIDVVPGVRVVQAVDFVSDDSAFRGTMTVTWEVADDPSGTLVSIRAEDVPDGISAHDHALGMAQSLANLAQLLEG